MTSFRVKNIILTSNFSLEKADILILKKYVYVFHCLGQFGHPAVHEFAFQHNWINYIDFPVGDYVTCNHN